MNDTAFSKGVSDPQFVENIGVVNTKVCDNDICQQ